MSDSIPGSTPQAAIVAADVPKQSTVRIVAAGMIGTVVEYYDFLIYATAAGLVFGKVFFPGNDPFVATLLAWGTFSVSYLARPLGSIIFGHMGDRLGRTRVLYITIIMMGVSTVGIGLLPTYAQIGVAAPIILVLLRVVQGVGVGGEYGGAALLMIEHAHDSGRRGLMGSLATGSSSIGFLLGTAMMALLTSITTPEQFETWVWRVPFLISGVLLLVGFYIRRNIRETPLMEKKLSEDAAKGETQRAPLRNLIRNNPRRLLIALAVPFGSFAAYYVVLVFSVPYVSGLGKVDSSFLLTMSTIAQLVYVFAVFFGGYISDKVGRKLPMLVGSFGLVVWIYAFFPLLMTGRVGGTLLAFVVALVFVGLIIGPTAAFLAELFETGVRYSGLSIGYQFSAAIAGGLSPLIATVLTHQYGTWVPVAIMVGAAGLVTITALILAPERSHSTLQ
jgi:MFS family permease